MYAFIEGTLEEKSAAELVVSAAGVGYSLFCSAATLAAAPARGETVRVYCWLNVREDALELFGFLSKDEKNLFLKLNSISGIGPRTALGIVGSMPLRELTLAIMTGDAQVLSRAPGVGKKTAQRIALELKDKLSAGDFSAGLGGDLPTFAAEPEGAVGEALLALQGLGYTQSEAARAVSAARKQAGDAAGADELVRLALRGITKG